MQQVAVMENTTEIERWMVGEEEEEEQVVGLMKRHSTLSVNGNGNVSPSTTPSQSEKEEEEDDVSLDVPLVVGAAQSELQEEKVSEIVLESFEMMGIFFDKEDGGESSNGINQMAFSTLGSSFADKKVETKESGLTLNGVDIEKTLTNGNNHQCHGSQNNEESSGLHLLLNGNSSENGIAGVKSVEGHANIILLKEDKQEVAEWDVERVLNKQETHHLFCPNCNSCITKRVILRKRKRILENVQYIKHEKIEEVKSSSIAANASSDQDHNRTQADVDSDSPVLGTDGHDPDSESDLFRCLTCFSFFIPTVSGFKLFWSSRKSGEGESVQSSERVDDWNTDKQGNVAMQVDNKVEPSNTLPYVEKNLQSENLSAIPKTPGAQLGIFPHDIHIAIDKYKPTIAGNDVMVSEEVKDIPGIPTTVQTNIVPSAPQILTDIENQNESSSFEWDILKSIVYGGLIESITSLSVVSSAAGGDATTMNIVALGLANLVGGLFVLAHGLRDLKNDQYGGAVDQNDRIDRYEETLGHRRNFCLHATVAVISYLLCGLVAPITYGSAFYKSDNNEYKLMAVAAASLFCVILLAIGKEYTRRPPKYYIKTVLYYFSTGIMSSGLSYVVGVLIDKLLKKLGLFESGTVASVPPSSVFLETLSTNPSWASY